MFYESFNKFYEWYMMFTMFWTLWDNRQSPQLSAITKQYWSCAKLHPNWSLESWVTLFVEQNFQMGSEIYKRKSVQISLRIQNQVDISHNVYHYPPIMPVGQFQSGKRTRIRRIYLSVTMWVRVISSTILYVNIVLEKF